MTAPGVRKQDVHEMEQQIKNCEDFGLVSLELQAAKVKKSQIKELLLQLQVSTSRRDLTALRAVLRDCTESQLPEPYMAEALNLKTHMETLLAKVEEAQ